MKKDDEIDDLVRRVQEGDRHAEEQLFGIMRGLVYSVARRHNIEGAEIEDLMQESYLAIYNAIKKYDIIKGNFYSYCRKCINNRLLDRQKESHRDKHKTLNQYVSLYSPDAKGSGELVESIAGAGNNPDEELIKKEEIEEFKKMIDLKLTVLEKNILYEYLDGKSYRETAATLDIPQKTVDNALTRIKKKLRD